MLLLISNVYMKDIQSQEMYKLTADKFDSID